MLALFNNMGAYLPRKSLSYSYFFRRELYGIFSVCCMKLSCCTAGKVQFSQLFSYSILLVDDLIGQYLGNIFQCTRFSVHVLVLLFVVLKKSWKLSKSDNNCVHNAIVYTIIILFGKSMGQIF